MTLNVDCDRNTETVERYLATHRPEVVCLQEVMKVDVPRFARAIGGHGHFVPMTRVLSHGEWREVGICILTSLQQTGSEAVYYVGSPGILHNLDRHDPASRREVEHRILLVSDIVKERVLFTFATTHFTWVPDGQPDDFQRNDVRTLIGMLQGLKEVVFCGDMNAVRGGEIFDLLATHLHDNVPATFATSIDPERHKVRGLRAMVDGIFSTPGMCVEHVDMTFGVSDHGALSATVSKR